MRKNRFFIGCGILSAAGIILAAAGIAAGGTVNGIQLDAGGLHVYAPKLVKEEEKSGYVQKEENIEAFDSISAELEYADIKIELSDTDEYGIAYGIAADWKFQYEVSGGRLTVRQKDEMSDSKTVLFRNFALFSFGDQRETEKKEYVTIRLPKDTALSSVDLNLDCGDAECEKFQADSIKIASEYGDVSLAGLQVKQLEAELDSGDFTMQEVSGDSCEIRNEYGNITLDRVNMSGNVSTEADSGTIRFQDTQMRDLALESEYGDVTAQEAQFRNIKMSLETGKCSLSGAAFDRCSILSEYGDVKIQLKGKLSEYGYELLTEYGNVSVGGKDLGDSYATLEENQDNLIEIKCDSGDIDIDQISDDQV